MCRDSNSRKNVIILVGIVTAFIQLAVVGGGESLAFMRNLGLF